MFQLSRRVDMENAIPINTSTHDENALDRGSGERGGRGIGRGGIRVRVRGTCGLLLHADSMTKTEEES